MTAEQKYYINQILETNLEICLFDDFINLVKLDNSLLNSFEFVNLMFNVGWNEKVFNIPKSTADNFYKQQLAIYKDTAFAQYASRLHFILLTF
jgi:type II restriction/modification system DNA methylase subunit YeeA